MECSVLVFSPTGGTARTAGILAASLDARPKIYDLARADFSFSGGDGLAIIAMPAFGGRAPSLAAERFKQARGNGMPCVLLCVYGNRAYEDTLVEMADLAADQGFKVVAAVAAIAQHSICPQFGAGRPDAQDEAALQSIANKILQKLEAGSHTDFAIPGNRPYKKGGRGSFVPMPDASCTACGLCAARCPSGAISNDDPAVVEASRCISCMRCVRDCPFAARKVDAEILDRISSMLQKACTSRRACEYFL